MIDSFWMIQCKSRLADKFFNLTEDLMSIFPLKRKNKKPHEIVIHLCSKCRVKTEKYVDPIPLRP